MLELDNCVGMISCGAIVIVLYPLDERTDECVATTIAESCSHSTHYNTVILLNDPFSSARFGDLDNGNVFDRAVRAFPAEFTVLTHV